MVLPFSSKANATPEPTNEPPRILTEEEQILLAIDQGTHEVKKTTSTIFELRTFSSFVFFCFFSLNAREIDYLGMLEW